MSPIYGLMNTPNYKFCLSKKDSSLVVQKKDVSNSAIQNPTMNVHNKTQFTYSRINCALKVSSYRTILPKI